MYNPHGALNPKTVAAYTALLPLLITLQITQCYCFNQKTAKQLDDKVLISPFVKVYKSQHDISLEETEKEHTVKKRGVLFDVYK